MKDRLERIIKGIVSSTGVDKVDAIVALAYLICENAYVVDERKDSIHRIPVMTGDDYFPYYEEKYVEIGNIIVDTFDVDTLDYVYEYWFKTPEILLSLYDQATHQSANIVAEGVGSWMRELLQLDKCSKVLMPFGGDYAAISSHPETKFVANVFGSPSILFELYKHAHFNVEYVCDGYDFHFELACNQGEVDAIYIPMLPIVPKSDLDKNISEALMEIMDYLKPGGRAIIALPVNYCQGMTMQSFRKWMVENKYLRQVIRVHGREFGLRTAANMYILVLEKSPNTADSYIWSMPTKSNLNLQELTASSDAAAFLDEIRIEQYSASTTIPYSKVFEDGGDNLYDPLSIIPELPHKEGWKSVKLSSILAPITMSKSVAGDEVGVLDMKTENSSEYNIRTFAVNHVQAQGNEWVLQEPALCVNGFNLQYMFVKATTEDPVALKKTTKAFRITDKRITQEYLQYALGDAIVQSRLERFKKNFSGSVMRPEMILRLWIYIPDVQDDEQFANLLILDIKEAQDSLLTEKERELKGAYESFAKDVHMRKHALGQTMYSLDSDWAYLKQVLEENFDCSIVVGRKFPKSISQIIDNISKRIDFARNQVNSLTVDNDFGEKEIFGIFAFLKEYIQDHGSTKFNYVAEFQPKEIKVVMRKKALQQVLDNLINNAVEHAFYGQEGSIKIDFFEERETCEIIVSNTGKPIAEDLRDGSLFIKGESTKLGRDGHGGIGCAQAKELLEQDGADILSEFNDGEEFVTSFKIIIPKSEENDV